MNKNKNGSTLLCILIVMNIMIPTLCLLMISSGFISEQYVYHVHFANKKNRLHALLHYSISLCMDYFDFFHNELQINDVVKEDGLQLNVSSWPLTQNVHNEGTIIIKRHHNSLLIKSTLYENNQSVVFCASCTLHKNEQQQWVIENWQSGVQKK